MMTGTRWHAVPVLIYRVEYTLCATSNKGKDRVPVCASRFARPGHPAPPMLTALSPGSPVQNTGRRD